MDREIIIAQLAHPMEVTVFSQTDSTNARALALIREGLTAPHLLAAESQTAGRGRLGRGFHSPPGGLYLSLILPPVPRDSLHLITPAAAVAACRAIEEVCGIQCGIKWVNDLEVHGKKVCGILTQTAGSHVVVGIGVNLWPAGPLPPDIAGRAAPLLPAPRPCLPEALAAALANRLLSLLPALSAADFLAEYRRRSTLLGQSITVHGPQGPWPAEVLGIDARARLVVRGEDGRITALHSGQVSVRLSGAAPALQ